MSNQSEHIFVEIENKEKKHEVKYESVIKGDCLKSTRKYFAISPEGNFLVELKEIELEVAELANILDTDIFKTIKSDPSSAVWAVWDIFSSLRVSVKLNQQKFILEFPSIGVSETGLGYVEKSNSCIVVYQKNDDYNKLLIYDDLVADKYFNLKESDKQDWITRDLEDNTQEFKVNKLHEPWLFNEDDAQHSFYLDKKKEKLLIIVKHTVQIWYRGTLKFIHSSSSFFDIPNLSELGIWYLKKIEVIGIKYCSEKFKFSIQIKDAEGVKQIKMDDEDNIMHIAKYACNTLEYFSVYKKKFEEIYILDKLKSGFDDFIEQMRKIILKLIRLYPTEWQLLDIRFDLMSTLVKAGEYELVYYILSFGKPIHIPQYLPWSDKENTTSTTISTAFSEDNTMLTCFLEYYSNNAIHNIEWMNTVVDIIPELFKSNDENGIREIKNYEFYAQKLFYSSCFCDKEFDLFSFEILEVSPKSNDLLKVYIPITQLIPQKSKLVLQKIDYDKIVNIRMVPLIDFTTNKKMLDIKKKKLTNFIEILLSPSRYLFPGEMDYSPFIKLIQMGECDILYENPSMGAIINWMCKKSDNPFSNIIDAILAVYDWSSISFDAWNFWPLTIISVIGSFIFVIILQNVIISFMDEAFSNVVEDSKCGLYHYQIDLIREFALLENSLEFSDLDYKFKDKIRAKYICFYDDPNLTKSWKEKSEQIRSKPYPKMQTLSKSEYETLSTQEDIYSFFSNDESNNESNDE
ncbi:33194_t:CDS:2 [Gigaspora margarita]|uniref:33194_t:CDS:1 n=1 Tax=Gigaspora margarita TaxID=4874 RepID=A0ABM8W493_GIGMA|nr:33194_t:CDS:2 [Gigaspora margarita]